MSAPMLRRAQELAAQGRMVDVVLRGRLVGDGEGGPVYLAGGTADAGSWVRLDRPTGPELVAVRAVGR